MYGQFCETVCVFSRFVEMGLYLAVWRIGMCDRTYINPAILVYFIIVCVTWPFSKKFPLQEFY